jgi:hypothetical protein
MVRSVAAEGSQYEVGLCHKVSQRLFFYRNPFSNYIHSIFDSDGEFLLIEAAEALPSWVKPSNTENRVRSPISFVRN